MSRGGAQKRSGALVTAVGLLVAIGMVGGCGQMGPARSVPIIISTPERTSTPAVSPTPAPIRVYVTGAVRQPEVYRLPQGSIVADAIEAAGGSTTEADLERINLAQELSDQQHVHVPRTGEENPLPAVSGADAPSALVNINTATLAELETLPGIGPVTAGKIIDYREAHGPFGKVEAIQDVPGIGPATFEGLKDLITVQ